MSHGKISLHLAVATLFVAGTAAAAEVDERESYSYVAAIAGAVTVAAPGEGPGERADINQPLLVGDEVRLGRGSRAEVILADRNVLRIDGDSVVTLAQVAFSADRDDRVTRLDLAEGEILLVVGDDALGDQLPEVRTAGATVYLQEPGTYRVEADGDGAVEVVVREGYAELVTDQGSSIVRAGEAGSVGAGRWGRVEIFDAGPEDALERWGQERFERYAESDDPYVDDSLAYSAAPLRDYGSWIYVDSDWYWRPRVEVGWRPYWSGRWCPTPSGLTWVSYEPWGWVPYHYGTWIVNDIYGWIWSPGYVYSPAWVYWSWGPRYVGWCPVGYYTHYYRPNWGYGGFRWGTYGWAGGGWDLYADWHFVPTWCVYERRWDRHQRTGRDHHRRGDPPPTGVITVDTHEITRERLRNPDRIPNLLADERKAAGGTMPDVTDFVARRRDLPETVRTAVAEPAAKTRLAGTPLAPDTPGKVQRTRRDDPPGRSARAVTPGAPSGKDLPAGDPTEKRRVVDERRGGTVARPEVGARGRGAVEDEKPRPQPGAGREVVGEPAPRTRSGNVGDSSDRQGWKKGAGTPSPRTGADDTPRMTPRSRDDGSGGSIGTKPGTGSPGARSVDREEPVRRVVGGVRGRVDAPLPGAKPSSPTPPPGQRWKQDTGKATPAPRSSSGSGSSTRSAPEPRRPAPAKPERRESTPPPSRPSYSLPSSPRSSASEPGFTRPRSEPSYSRPRGSEPSYSRPRASEPSYTRPRSEPSYSRPRASEPSYSRPRASQPSSSQPRASAPSSSQTRSQAPSYSQPRSQAPSYSSPPSSSRGGGSSAGSSSRSSGGKSSGSGHGKHGKG